MSVKIADTKGCRKCSVGEGQFLHHNRAMFIHFILMNVFADLLLLVKMEKYRKPCFLDFSSSARNPYTDSTFLCAAVPSGLVLLLWYEPLQKFMHLKVTVTL